MRVTLPARLPWGSKGVAMENFEILYEKSGVGASGIEPLQHNFVFCLLYSNAPF